MYISREQRDELIQELSVELGAKLDGGRKNLIVPICPYCGHAGGKFGIYVGPETSKKKLFMGHCFSCGHTVIELNRLLDDIGRPDLKIEDTACLETTVTPLLFNLDEDEIDDELNEVKMPEGWKRCYKNPYLKSRGFTFDDYSYFPVGTTRGLNFKFDNYVLFQIIDNGMVAGYIGRHTWSKDRIDDYNRSARLAGKYEIRRYNNSGFREDENEFVKLLFNYDAVIEDETDTVILCEGVFDVIALTRKLDLYDNHRIAAVATFGKKISETQAYKLQAKGVKTVVIGYDSDAMDAINSAAAYLTDYFDVYIAKIDSDGKDWDEMDFWDIYDTFSLNLLTPREYKLTAI